MLQELQRHLGHVVIVVYLKSSGRFSRRIVQFQSISTNFIRVFDFDKQAPRTFRVENIMAVQRVITNV